MHLFSRERCCSFSGHRPEKLRADEGKVRALLGAAIDKAMADGYDTFISGMARGVDQWAAELVLARRDAGQPVRLIAALPCPVKERGNGKARGTHLAELINRADAVEVISPCYHRGCFHKRNAWMIDHASRLIAVYGGCAGGTGDTIARAERAGLEIVEISL